MVVCEHGQRYTATRETLTPISDGFVTHRNQRRGWRKIASGLCKGLSRFGGVSSRTTVTPSAARYENHGLIHNRKEYLDQLAYIPSDVDIWGALVKPYDIGDQYSKFFSTYLGTDCKLAYVNLKRPRYIQGPLPPDYAQNGKHPETGLSDGAQFLFIRLQTVCLCCRICTEESMEDLNSRMEEPMSVIRFRPNLVLRGGKAFDEDNWAEITIVNAGKFWLLSRSPRYEAYQLSPTDIDVNYRTSMLKLEPRIRIFRIKRW